MMTAQNTTTVWVGGKNHAARKGSLRPLCGQRSGRTRPMPNPGAAVKCEKCLAILEERGTRS